MGTWVGVCHNQTVDVKSPMILSLSRRGSHVTGNLKLDSARLVSAPHVEGVIQGNTVTFTTGMGSGRITWQGQIVGPVFAGSYSTASGQAGVFKLLLK